MITLRVTSPVSERLTRYPRSLGRAEDRAKTLARLVGTAEIQRRDGDSWLTVETYDLRGYRVVRRGER